ncbi:MAG: T3SS effector HopA1 family protein [Rivularia sp. (in: cyanobacteria)]
MNLFDSLSIQPNNESTKRLLHSLTEITTLVEIDSNLAIVHPDYKPFSILDRAGEYFGQMPQEAQKKYLGVQLRNFIYGIYYNGYMQNSLKLDGEGNDLSLMLENNTFLGVDLEFHQRLHQSNIGTGYFEPGWYIIREEVDGSLAVKKSDLRLHIQRKKHLQPEHQFAVVGDCVAIKMPKNLVQNGFYVAVANMGLHRYDNSENQSVTVRVYFNFTPGGAVAVMGSLTKHLNQLEIPNYFKVLYNPKEYQRYDCGVLYFDKRDYEAVREVLQIVYQDNKSHFKADIPLFTKHLAPGLALAEEPKQKFTSSESFGMNRCQIVANGLLEAWYEGDNSPLARIKAILKQFSLLEIDLQRVYLNGDSEDIYTQLNQKIF